MHLRCKVSLLAVHMSHTHQRMDRGYPFDIIKEGPSIGLFGLPLASLDVVP